MSDTAAVPPGRASATTDRPGRAGRLAPFVHLLLHTPGGWFLLAGTADKAACWLARLALGREPTVLGVLDALGSVALIAAVICLVLRLVARVRRRFLWRVRQKLILSYVFIGVVPALLIVTFFVVSGLILFLNVAAYLVTNGINNVRNEAVYQARLTALEIQSGPGPAGAEGILAQRGAALAAAYPGASMALVPTTGPEPCVGGPTAGPLAGQLPPSVAAAEPSRVEATPGSRPAHATPVRPVAVGAWDHTEMPDRMPTWVSCAGFGGIVVEPVGSKPTAPQDAAPAIAVVRGVGLPDAARPTYAVIVDIPRNDALDNHLRDETSVKMGELSIYLTDTLRDRLARRSKAIQGWMGDTDAGGGGKRRILWVAILQGIDWDTGQRIPTTAKIHVNIADIYDRLSSTPTGQTSIGTRVLLILMVVAALFLVIEASALVMGLALARSITGSVHELFEGTERVRAGDFSHRIEVRTHDQLGELSESFNQMTGSIEDLLRQAEEKKRLEEELRIARQIQMSLLPRGQLTIPGISISALCVPAREVGGDYYDFFALGDDRLGVLIADVSGKGTYAALYMAELKGLMLSLSRTCPSPRQVMTTANQIISKNLDSRSFITMTYAVIDLVERTIVWARAGHTPLIRRQERDGEPVVDVLTPDGLVLGLRIDGGELFERLLTEVSVPLSRGDVFMFFTDGISEAMNEDSDLFGEARLAHLVEEHGNLEADELRERILREIDAFVAGAPQHDDMTMILLKVDDFVPGAVKTGFDDGRA